MSGRVIALVSVLGAMLFVILAAFPPDVGAHAGNNDPLVIHACINNSDKSVRIVGVGGNCITSPASKAETASHWAITGPAGIQGPPGLQGPPGPTGPSVYDAQDQRVGTII